MKIVLGVGVLAGVAMAQAPDPLPSSTVLELTTFASVPTIDRLLDCDGDGSLTLFDILCFQNAFDAGCG